jgi:hypothetical protein
MRELIVPQQSEWIVLGACLILSLVGLALGWRYKGLAGVCAVLLGPLIYVMWRFHTWITRYDPVSGYFGLDKVTTLALEVVLFVAVGFGLGWFWSRLGGGEKGKTQKRI